MQLLFPKPCPKFPAHVCFAIAVCCVMTLGGVLKAQSPFDAPAMDDAGFGDSDFGDGGFGDMDFGGADFGNPGFDDDQPDATGDGQSGTEEDPDAPPAIADTPLVRQTLDLASRKPSTIPTAVKSMATIGQWAAVEQLLVALDEPDDATLRQIAVEMGPALILRAGGREELSDASRDILRKAQSALADQHQSDERLSAAIDDVLSDSIDRRLGGNRVLLRGGNASIQQIIGRMLEQPELASNRDLIALLRRLGKGGARSLIQHAIYGDASAQQVALTALAGLRSPWSDLLAASALHGQSTTQETRETAASLLARHGKGLPSKNATVAAIGKAIDMQSDRISRVVPGQDIATAWTLDPDTGVAAPVQTDALAAERRRATDLASILRRIADVPASLMRDAAIADAGYRVLVDPDFGDDDQIEAMLAAYPELSTAIGMNDFLDKAWDSSDFKAISAGLAIIGSGVIDVPSELLDSHTATPTTLVRLASSSLPRIRYDAAMTIRKIDPGVAFAGRSQVDRTIAAMQKLSPGPVAILIETRPNVRAELETVLTQLGYQVRTVGTVAGALSEIVAGGDIRFILSKTQLWDAQKTELADRVRRTSLGRRLPILFFVDDTTTPFDLDQLEYPRWPAITRVIARPYSTAGLIPVLQEIEMRQPVVSLEAVDRELYRRWATESL
ncbi:hypothetical protein V7x_29270 [Crateriforma conspicua]|uniref:Response regulatory domain-containing protein n=1 Tax=Crateriforma conspicua TaxID=2527996 RepID=A0A5C6G2B8_9PLAN|nr:hypothetical protein [Crateriforma conspicua]TWU67353.1 hypothetical protein V7x_29270 [Crateriforma conspicua]